MALKQEVRDGTGWVWLDRPQARNALDLETIAALHEAVDSLEANPDVERAVLAAQGPSFCAGGDFQEMINRRGKAAATFERHLEGLGALVRRMQESRLVWIARVQGPALGAGLGLVLACDLGVAGTSASFGAPFGRIGLVADTVVSHMLSQTVGMRTAKRLLLTGESIEAQEAQQMGIVHDVVADSELDTCTEAWIAKLAALPAGALARIKRQVWRNASVPLREAATAEALLQGLSFATPEHHDSLDKLMASKKKGGAK